MSNEIIGYCWNCGHALTRLEYGRESYCDACAKPTHCCRNCRHYAPGRSNECMEPLVERVLDKTRANFCDWFEPTPQAPGSAANAPDPDLLRRAADALFKT